VQPLKRAKVRDAGSVDWEQSHLPAMVSRDGELVPLPEVLVIRCPLRKNYLVIHSISFGKMLCPHSKSCGRPNWWECGAEVTSLRPR
jgi:hypothetical protein